MEKRVFCGIDPGRTGGIGIIDLAGKFVFCQRWSEKNPVSALYILNRPDIEIVYLEVISSFTKETTTGQIVRNQSTLINFGLWQGFILAAGYHFGPGGGAHLISPRTWQAIPGYDLTSWQKRTEAYEAGGPHQFAPRPDSPLTLARRLWPGAPLEFQADDGKAVGLLLANLARLDHARGIDRGELRRISEVKEKTRKKKIRAARKAAQNPENRQGLDIPY